MKIGTKSLLFGVHQFALHPLFVLMAWLVVYRSWPKFYQLCAIIVHDWGYWGCGNMDGREGEDHPGSVVVFLCSKMKPSPFKAMMFDEILGHSRFAAASYGVPLSPLFRADKMASALYPRWLYLLLGNLTGEIKEYMRHGCIKGEGKYSDVPKAAKTQTQWLIETQAHMALMGLHGENYGPVAEQLGIK